MLQKFKITSYAFIVVFMTAQVFTIPASGSHLGHPHPEHAPNLPFKEDDREKAVEPAKERKGLQKGVEAEGGGVVRGWGEAEERVIDCNVGLSAYISAMTEIINTLQEHREAFAGRIDTCQRMPTPTRESYEPQVHGRCVYYDAAGGGDQPDHRGDVSRPIMYDMFTEIDAFHDKMKQSRQDMHTECRYKIPARHYRHCRWGYTGAPGGVCERGRMPGGRQSIYWTTRSCVGPFDTNLKYGRECEE